MIITVKIAATDGGRRKLQVPENQTDGDCANQQLSIASN
jgi:hypothetical protein